VQTVVETPRIPWRRQIVRIIRRRAARHRHMDCRQSSGWRRNGGNGRCPKSAVRWKRQGEKRGLPGNHVFFRTDIPVFLLNIFAKNEKTDLAPEERRVLKSVLANIVQTYGSRRESR